MFDMTVTETEAVDFIADTTEWHRTRVRFIVRSVVEAPTSGIATYSLRMTSGQWVTIGFLGNDRLGFAVREDNEADDLRAISTERAASAALTGTF